jgi:5-methyltetrahydropteroyltriglutamate--homocysteine methyltransferase
MEFVDPERMLPCTNCGMAPLPRRIAEGKIVALGAGARLMRKELGGA